MSYAKKAIPSLMETRELNKGEEELIRVQTHTDERGCATESPVLRFAELLQLTKVRKSKAYDLMNPKSPGFDPEYPTGFPLFDSPRSPRVYWRHEAIAWLDGRSKKFKEYKQGISK
jgi:predicted DNA-binding transcriptional regulator AlpA